MPASARTPAFNPSRSALRRSAWIAEATSGSASPRIDPHAFFPPGGSSTGASRPPTSQAAWWSSAQARPGWATSVRHPSMRRCRASKSRPRPSRASLRRLASAAGLDRVGAVCRTGPRRPACCCPAAAAGHGECGGGRGRHRSDRRVQLVGVLRAPRPHRSHRCEHDAAACLPGWNIGSLSRRAARPALRPGCVRTLRVARRRGTARAQPAVSSHSAASSAS